MIKPVEKFPPAIINEVFCGSEMEPGVKLVNYGSILSCKKTVWACERLGHGCEFSEVVTDGMDPKFIRPT